MGKPNVSRQALVEAIATLEVQRGPSGREQGRAIDTILMALREKLAQVQAEPGDQTRSQLTVLVADLSGFTALSEYMDVEQVRNAINAMWAVLDAVILAWGGQIEQHAGDSLMALFGLPYPRGGDAARALYAALAMQEELALFNERASSAAAGEPDGSWAGHWPGPDMRIGVHSGQVYFAHAPGRAAAVGDAVAQALRLEELAPAGGVLTSADTRLQALSRFEFATVPSLASSPDGPAYLVTAERPLATGYVPGKVAGQVTRLVGRADLMDQLDVALQTAADSGTPHLVTIVGQPGAGKSRLVHEFERHARLISGAPVILRAGTQGAFPHFPYALVRDLLLRRFSIRPQHGRYLIEQRLRQGVGALVAAWREEAAGDTYTRTLGLLERLLDARTAAAIPVDEALDVVGTLLAAITRDGPALLVLEGINRADRRSLELVDRLVHEGAAGPLLILGLATATDETSPEQMLPWIGRPADAFSPVERLDVPPLSAVDSRLMATEILSSLSPSPQRLLDLVVAESGGNPLYIESFIQLLIDRGVITTGSRRRVDFDRLEKIALPAGLAKLIESQLAILPESERRVLQYAAVFGPLCWGTALIDLIPAEELPEAGVEAAFLSLALKGYLAGDDLYNFGASQAYGFRRDSVREAAYATIEAAERDELHLQAARWLIANQDNARMSAWFSIDMMIAGHFAAAGDGARAEIWQRRAGLPAGE